MDAALNEPALLVQGILLGVAGRLVDGADAEASPLRGPLHPRRIGMIATHRVDERRGRNEGQVAPPETRSSTNMLCFGLPEAWAKLATEASRSATSWQFARPLSDARSRASHTHTHGYDQVASNTSALNRRPVSSTTRTPLTNFEAEEIHDPARHLEAILIGYQACARQVKGRLQLGQPMYSVIRMGAIKQLHPFISYQLRSMRM